MPRTQHAFYAEEKTGRTIWQHPYDDPDFLRSLPDTHPANPNSAEAKAAKAKYEEQKRLAAQRGTGASNVGAGSSTSSTSTTGSTIRPPNHEKRHGVKGFTDKILGGNPDERRYKKEKRREEERVGDAMTGGGERRSGGDRAEQAAPIKRGGARGEGSATSAPGTKRSLPSCQAGQQRDGGGRYAPMPSDPCNVQ